MFLFSWHGFLQVVLLLIRKKSGGSFMLNLRPFFQLKENVPICTIRFFFSITKFENYYNLEN